MKIIVDRDVLADAVAWAARALPTRPTQAVLSGIRLQTGGSLPEDGTAETDLSLSSFDYDVSAQATIPVTIQEPGSVLVSGRLLAEICRSLPNHPVQLVVESGHAVLTCGAATFTLACMPEDEYPALPDMPQPAGTVGSDAFATAVGQVAAAAGRDDTLPALTGVRIEIEDDLLTLLATDRYRMAMRELNWKPTDPRRSGAVLVPARPLVETARALVGGAEVSIALTLPDAPDEPGGAAGDGMIGFEGVGRRSTTRLLGGEFPPVRRLLPASSSSVAELPVGALTEAVKRAALVADRNSAIRLSFTSGQLLLEAGTGDEAQAEEVLEASVEGDDISIAFNPQYLLDGLGALESETVRMSFTDSEKAALVSGGSDEYRYLLMPKRFG